MASSRGSAGHFDGHDKEPKSLFGGKGARGKHPPVHSHSAKHHRKVGHGKSGRKGM